LISRPDPDPPDPGGARSLDPPICRRCGACCHYKDAEGRIKKCRFLVYLSVNPPITNCRIYARRLGTIVGRNEIGAIYCGERGAHQNEPGCPYNRV